MIKNMANMMILASRSYLTNVQLAKSVKNMLNESLTLGRR
jgi:flagellar basal body rod protein FlgC